MVEPRTLHAPAPPLLVTGDERLSGAVSRLAAAAGVGLDTVTDPGVAVRAWGAASAVLVGPDLVGAVASLGPVRREGVHVVVSGAVDDALFRVALEVGAGSVVGLPAADDWLVRHLADCAEGRSRLGTVVGVVGGSGGVGASTLAAALASTAAREARAVLVDLDPLGPGAGRLLGLDGARGVGWPDLASSRGRLAGRVLRESLPGRDGLRVLGWPSGEAARPDEVLVREVLAAARRGHDWVVLDLPRWVPDRPDLLSRCDHLVVVSGASVGPVAATARLVPVVRPQLASVGVVVRCRRRWTPVAEDVAAAVGLPLWGTLGDQRRLEEHLDLGLGPVRGRRAPLAVTARALLAAVGEG